MAKRKSFLMRIDPRLFDGLQKWASDELRSVNGQVEFLLTQALRRSGRWPVSFEDEESLSGEGEKKEG